MENFTFSFDTISMGSVVTVGYACNGGRPFVTSVVNGYGEELIEIVYQDEMYALIDKCRSDFSRRLAAASDIIVISKEEAIEIMTEYREEWSDILNEEEEHGSNPDFRAWASMQARRIGEAQSKIFRAHPDLRFDWEIDFQP